jgi:hypothetical protein
VTRIAGLTLVALTAVQASAQAETRRYAVVVASGQDLSGKSAALEYADDDGARYYELFSQLADQVELYAVLDSASQRLHPGAARVARPPRRAELVRGLERVFASIQSDVDRGKKVSFTFVLVGHGQIGAGGEGYVSLLDHPFTRTDLFRTVLARSPATTNHVVVDACNSYFLVHRRGGASDAGPSRKDAIRRYLAAEDLARYPNTGVFLSTSSEKESHEWSAFSAGVFSHQLRSALSGAADVNGDSKVEYSEVEAFIAAANLRVDDPRARIEVFARPPAIDRSRPMVELVRSRFRHFVRFPAGPALPVYLEDARGVRYADLHLSGERAVVVGLVPSRRYFVRSRDGRREARLDLARPGRIDFDRGRMKPSALAARGSVAESFREDLYAEPYGPSFYRGFVAQSGGLPVERSAGWLPRAARPGVMTAAYLREEVSRLSEDARRDPPLRRRLRRASPVILRALGAGRLEEAARLIDRAAGRR